MVLPVIDRNTLSCALGKVNRLKPGDIPDFSPEELIALFAFTEGKVGHELECRRQSEFVARLNAILSQFPKPLLEDIPADRRRNDLLRGALARIQAGLDITEGERAFVMATLKHLHAQPNLNLQQRRLTDIIESIMGLKSEISEAPETLAPPSPTSPSIEEAPEVESAAEDRGDWTVIPSAEAFFLDCPREIVEELKGIPLNKHFHYREHHGSLELQGGLPEQHLLRVIDGDVLVKGQVNGIVWGERGISIDGDVLGGWVISEQGNIEAGRAAANARIVARRGSVILDQAENPECVFAAMDCRISGDASDGRLTASKIHVGGAVRDCACHALVSVQAGKVLESSGDRNQIVFRQLLSPEDFGGVIEDDTQNLIRNALRASYRAYTSEAWVTALMREKTSVQMTILYALRANPKSTPTPQQLRNAHLMHIYLKVLISIAERGQAYLLRAIDAPADMVKLQFASAADDIQNAARVLEKEIELVPEEVARTAKPAVLMGGRHLVNAIKKAKDAVGQGKAADGPLEALAMRIREWKQQLEQASQELDTIQQAADEVLGPVAKAGPEALEKLLNGALADAGPKATSGLLRMLRSGLERIGPAIEKWNGMATAARSENRSLQDRLNAETGIFMGGVPSDALVQAESWGVGALICPMRQRATPICEQGTVRVEREMPEGGAFGLLGLQVVAEEKGAGDTSSD